MAGVAANLPINSTAPGYATPKPVNNPITGAPNATAGSGYGEGQTAGEYLSGELSALPPSLSGLLTGTSSATPSLSALAPAASVAPVNTTDATTQAFARAKDQAGAQSRASLQSLNGELGAQGMLGGGAQYTATANALAAADNPLAAESANEANTTANLTQQTNLANQSNATTQRGQDIGQQEANANLALAKQTQQYNLLTSILKGLSSGPATGLSY